MNTFADSLFSVLFGGIRSLVQGIWSAVVDGNFSGFFSWLGDHWFWLVLFLCLIGTVIDFIIWLIRWRPYLVWRTNMRRLFRHFQGGKDDPRQFETGYTDGVALDLPDESEPAQQYFPSEEKIAVYNQPAVLPEEFSAPRFSAAEEAPLPQENYAPPVYFQQADAYAPLPGQPMPVVPRRRRSDKHAQKKASWHERLVADDEQQDALLDGLPPAVDREQAFHEPVYPQASANYSAWKKPENHQMNG